ncbi:MAG TPA: hypothetical protein VN903_29045, partial [Polyangia bacterium]|nr:hypothetical protein [Polyangia bacterium]
AIQTPTPPPPPAPRAAPPSAPATHGPSAAVRVPPAQGRPASRKRATATSDTTSPTEAWVDPFTQ